MNGITYDTYDAYDAYDACAYYLLVFSYNNYIKIPTT